MRGHTSQTRRQPSWTPIGAWRGFWPALAGIVAVGVVVRVVYTLVEAPWPPAALDDQFYFSAMPNLLAQGEDWIAPFDFVFHGRVRPTAEHPPLHSVLLAGVSELGGTSGDAQRLTGTIFGVGTITTLGVLARRLGGDRAGLLAAGLAAVYPVLVAADGALMSESLYGLLAALALLAAYRLLDEVTVVRAALLGAVGGLAALTRGEALVLLPLVLLPVWRRPGGPRATLVAVLACALVLAPWTVRNWLVFDRPVLIATNAGTAVAGANCDDTYYSDKLGGWSPPCIRSHSGNEAERHAEALADGVRYAGDHVGRLPVVLAVRLGRVWSVYDPFQTPEGRSLSVQKLGTVMFFLLVPLAAAGTLVLRRRGLPVWILIAPFVVVSVTALISYGNVRFRQPAELSLVVLAAIALDGLRWRRPVR